MNYEIMKRKPLIIAMLTHNDITVKDAYDVFMSSCDLDVNCWGFKNTGIDKDDMFRLVKIMKDKGKKTFLEILEYNEVSCLNIVKTAVECQFDEITGTLNFPSVHKYLKDKNIPYKPFAGNVSGIPGVLNGTYEEILYDAKKLLENGAAGLNLLAYRHRENGEELARKLCTAIKTPVCITGSISSFKHIDTILDITPWGFTIGTAFFERKFAADGTFRENLQAVVQYMAK